MSTFNATIRSRAQWDDLMANWPFGWLVRRDNLDYCAVGDGWISHVECALKRLEAGEFTSLGVCSLDQPNTAGEPCEFCHDYIVEAFCRACAMTEEDMERTDPTNRLMFHEAGEHAVCRRCYLTGLLRDTLDVFTRGQYATPHMRRS